MSINGKRIGLALSGGGYRATLFGLGSLWRLNDAGLLGRLDRITSVSGGSILNGVLAHRWSSLSFHDGRAQDFRERIADPVREFCSHTIDIAAGVLGMLVPFKTAGEFLADRYAKALFGQTTLKALPGPADGAPLFVFYATNMQTGRSFRFRPDMIADYMLGLSRSTVVRLADAVAASSAFPPIFSPVILETDPAAWEDGEDIASRDELRKRIVLADGGVYDNMGLQTLLERVDVSLVSDAGAPFSIELSPREDNLLQLGRVRDILIDQTRALRKSRLIDDYEAGRLHGAYWGIGTEIDDYGLTDAMAKDDETSRALETIPTRLAAFAPERQGRLINWGYALADAALRSRAGFGTLPAPTAWPVPEHPPV